MGREVRIVVTDALGRETPVLYDGGDCPNLWISADWGADADRAEWIEQIVDGLQPWLDTQSMQVWARAGADARRPESVWHRRWWLRRRWPDSEVAAAVGDGLQHAWEFGERWGVSPYIAAARLYIYLREHPHAMAEAAAWSA